jgi:hypothetical protein
VFLLKLLDSLLHALVVRAQATDKLVLLSQLLIAVLELRLAWAWRLALVRWLTLALRLRSHTCLALGLLDPWHLKVLTFTR